MYRIETVLYYFNNRVIHFLKCNAWYSLTRHIFYFCRNRIFSIGLHVLQHDMISFLVYICNFSITLVSFSLTGKPTKTNVPTIFISAILTFRVHASLGLRTTNQGIYEIVPIFRKCCCWTVYCLYEVLHVCMINTDTYVHYVTCLT